MRTTQDGELKGYPLTLDRDGNQVQQKELRSAGGQIRPATGQGKPCPVFYLLPASESNCLHSTSNEGLGASRELVSACHVVRAKTYNLIVAASPLKTPFPARVQQSSYAPLTLDRRQNGLDVAVPSKNGCSGRLLTLIPGAGTLSQPGTLQDARTIFACSSVRAREALLCRIFTLLPESL
jgi:hypothetical protein